MQSVSSTAGSDRSGWAFLKPSLADLFFPILFLAAFGRAQTWQSLLEDGDTGWHIRTGDFILQSGHVPLRDLFSFSRPGEPWFAWEWLSDVLFSLLFRWHGLTAIAGFSACVLCLSAVLLLHWLLRRECGLWVALPVVLAVFSASSIHFLARPHIFSILFLIVLLWILDEDRRRRTGLVWLLAPLCALWANLHGGFVSALAILGLLAALSGARRYVGLFVLCSAATLVNPYGWQLHRHILKYLTSSWIMQNVQEFQSPNIRTENLQVFAVLLLIGVALVSRALARRQWFEGALVLVWGFAAMRSARHVPIYAVSAAPLIAQELAIGWAAVAKRLTPRSAGRILWDLSQEFGRSRQIGLWTLLAAVSAVWVAIPAAGLADFPENRFPVVAVARHLDQIRPPGIATRILTSDQWADYLIFHLYPAQRVFFDGRSDFYGPAVGKDYQALMGVGPGWHEVLDRYGFDVALLPVDWPLGAVLERDPGWQLVERNAASVFLVRRCSTLQQTPQSAEGMSVAIAVTAGR